MKTFLQVAVMASLACLLPVAGQAEATDNPGLPPNAFQTVVVPVAGPPVVPTVGTGPGQPYNADLAVSPVPAPDSQLLAESIENIKADFTKAKEAFARADLKLAALEVRRGAEALREQQYGATGNIRKELAARALDLELLAMRIEQARVKTDTDLEKAFIGADRALSEYTRAMVRTPETVMVPVVAAGPLGLTTLSPTVPAYATRQAMPYGESVNAAFAPPARNAGAAALSYEQLDLRMDALSKELSLLRKDLGRLKAQKAGNR